MTEKLKIRNFGPIKEADADIRDLTVFVGPQATGKSLAAQCLYFLRKYETLLKFGNTHTEAVSAFQWWFGRDSAIYTRPDTRLYWNPHEPSDETIHEIQWNHGEMQLSPILKHKQISSYSRDLPEKAEVYIPAGRTLYSFLPPYSLTSRILASEDWSGYILTFYETLGRTIQWLHREMEKGHETSAKNVFLEKRIQDIFKGKIQYTPETVSLKISEGTLYPTNIAAGQMEIWPFWAIVEAGIRSKRFESAFIYFEEPEAHLHPDAQRSVLEMVAYLVNHGTKFLLTTHSPYILYTINNFLMAQKVLDHRRNLPDNISKQTALRADQVGAYRFTNDGHVHDIMDREIGLIDESELDNTADRLGQEFTVLQDFLEADE